MRLYCDNKFVVGIAQNLVQHDKTKHAEVDIHFIKEKIKSGLICIPYVPTGEQLADILTKGVQNPSFKGILDKLGMKNLFY
jgi:formylmethanofuran dehydrogenase subunit D